MMQINGLRFLVVEDQTFLRWVVGNLLRDLGAKSVLLAGDGNWALKLLAAPDPPVDVVIADLDRPASDGAKLIYHLARRRHPAAVIAMSNRRGSPADGMDDVTSAFGIRFLGTIRKPPTAQRLREILDAETPQLTRMTR